MFILLSFPRKVKEYSLTDCELTESKAQHVSIMQAKLGQSFSFLSFLKTHFSDYLVEEMIIWQLIDFFLLLQFNQLF